MNLQARSSSLREGPRRGLGPAPTLVELMAGYASGDDHAFGPLWRRMGPKLRGYLSRRLRNDAAVDDVMQDALLRVHRFRNRFTLDANTSSASVEAWFITTAQFALLDYLRSEERRRSRRESLEHKADPAAYGARTESSDPEQELADNQEQSRRTAAVRAAVARLPERSKEIIVEHNLRGKPFSALAKELGVLSGTLRVRAHRAYRLLAAELTRIGWSADPTGGLVFAPES